MASDHQVYMPSTEGPFRCDHCNYYQAVGQCTHPKIIQLLGAGADGAAAVDPGGCSDYYEPVIPTKAGSMLPMAMQGLQKV